MSQLTRTLPQYWATIQGTLFPWLEEELDPFTKRQQQLIEILELIRIEEFIPDYFGCEGRPQKARSAIARSFVAKMVYNTDSTTFLIERLKSDKNLRRIWICCEYKADALRIRQSLGKRLEKFKLHLNEEKTKLVPFDKKAAAQGVKQGTFDFLGFTFYWGKSQTGRVNEWAKQIRHEKPMKEVWQIFKAKLRGHVQYYGVSHNIEKVNTFLYRATKIMFKWLNRRSQRKSFTWEKFQLFMRINPLPAGKIVHPLFKTSSR